MPSRRRLIWSGIGVAALGALAVSRPRDAGQPHDGYFASLQQGLRAAGIAQPTIVVDRERMKRNLARIGERARQQGLPVRVVVKSLPSLALVDAALGAWGSDRTMLFNAAQLVQIANERSNAKILLGKPLPAAAAQQAMSRMASSLDRVEWLVDTPQRLAQYRDLARAARTRLRLNIEIDVGLHRGGVESTDMLAQMLAIIRDEPLLAWSGFMGYDAHVTGIPDIAGSRAKAQADARARYDTMWTTARQVLPTQALREALTLNTGGSPTFHLHDKTGLPNEVAVGSAALKPSDFDIPSLAELEPAVFIATPVLKDLGRFRLPEGVGLVSSLARLWDPNETQAYAIHGGHWHAVPVSPAGIAPSGLFGNSSNQQVMVASAHTGLVPDDFVFFRPQHSEAVLLQFGDIALVEQGRVVEMAPVFAASA
ncbi:alanine racemase [Piscinibacter terrae]|uniref:DSD1 family PLP-dependent enzyme n=1 Tax=Piscinibacter terrae TaxID=2496871 RepID=A0A3N7HW80_9BURK|nr:alanine racemase [Albitalea terrae]RQP26577.1 DSD1 family PLP-dependent enzyme [Albitalea terrae]